MQRKDIFDLELPDRYKKKKRAFFNLFFLQLLYSQDSKKRFTKKQILEEKEGIKECYTTFVLAVVKKCQSKIAVARSHFVSVFY